jgi:tetratricopeptide (TPR) repeat protein
MRIRLAAAALALVALSTTTMVRAQQIAPRDIWPQAATLAREGDVDGANKRLNDLFATAKSYGIRSFPTYAVSAAAMARTAERENAPDIVKWADQTADRLDPHSPAVAFSKADRAAAKNDWAKAIPLAITGITRTLTNYRSGVLSRADLFIAASVAIAITAIIFAIALLVRYGKVASHDFRELLGTHFRGGSVSVLAFALLFAPIFLWLGPMWLVFYWFVIFFGYAAPVERIVIVVLALLMACVPLVLDAAANWTAGIDSPVVMSALSSSEQSYQPDALRRLQEVLNVSPDNAMLQLLVGNLQTFEGNDEQAAVHYRRAIELQKSYAGAHVNLGNLNFLDNEFQAAITEYEEAERADPNLAIAYYNHAVASGETYKFDQQAAMLEKARRADRAFVERLTRTPPQPKVVMYHPPTDEAWRISEQVSRKNRKDDLALFGNYSFFDPAATLFNPISLGALASIALGVALWLYRRKTGFAGACIKCGRTFCRKCKSARESATYCTQCIHIYLKRDGVSLDTKRHKLEEVTFHHSGMNRRNRLFATFLPGSAQILEGRTLAGLIGILLFALCAGIAIFTGRLAPALGPSASVAQILVRVLAIVIAIVIWFMLSLPVYRRRAVG